MESFELKEALHHQQGLEVFGQCVARILARAPSRYPEEMGEVVFVEVFDSGEDGAVEQRYVCWVFSCKGFPLLTGQPASEIEKAIDNLRWKELDVMLCAGVR